MNNINKLSPVINNLFPTVNAKMSPVTDKICHYLGHVVNYCKEIKNPYLIIGIIFGSVVVVSTAIYFFKNRKVSEIKNNDDAGHNKDVLNNPAPPHIEKNENKDKKSEIREIVPLEKENSDSIEKKNQLLQVDNLFNSNQQLPLSQGEDNAGDKAPNSSKKEENIIKEGKIHNLKPRYGQQPDSNGKKNLQSEVGKVKKQFTDIIKINNDNEEKAVKKENEIPSINIPIEPPKPPEWYEVWVSNENVLQDSNISLDLLKQMNDEGHTLLWELVSRNHIALQTLLSRKDIDLDDHECDPNKTFFAHALEHAPVAEIASIFALIAEKKRGNLSDSSYLCKSLWVLRQRYLSEIYNQNVIIQNVVLILNKLYELRVSIQSSLLTRTTLFQNSFKIAFFNDIEMGEWQRARELFPCMLQYDLGILGTDDEDFTILQIKLRIDKALSTWEENKAEPIWNKVREKLNAFTKEQKNRLVKEMLNSPSTSWKNDSWNYIPFDVLWMLLPMKQIAELWRQDKIEVVFSVFNDVLKDFIDENGNLKQEVYEIERYMLEYRTFTNRWDWGQILKDKSATYPYLAGALNALDEKRLQFEIEAKNALNNSDFSLLSFPKRLEDIGKDFLVELMENTDKNLEQWLITNKDAFFNAYIIYDVQWDENAEQVAQKVFKITGCYDNELYKNSSKLNFNFSKMFSEAIIKEKKYSEARLAASDPTAYKIKYRQLDNAYDNSKNEREEFSQMEKREKEKADKCWEDVNGLIKQCPPMAATYPFPYKLDLREIRFEVLEGMIKNGLWTTDTYGTRYLKDMFSRCRSGGCISLAIHEGRKKVIEFVNESAT